MAITLIQVQDGGNTGAISYTQSINPTAPRSLMVAGIGLNNISTGTRVVSVTSDVGDTFLQVPGALGTCEIGNPSNNVVSDIWYCPNSIGGATSVTVTLNKIATNYLSVVLSEYYGAQLATPVDSSANQNNGATTTSPIGPFLTSSTPSSLLVEVMAIQGSGAFGPTVNAPWTLENGSLKGIAYADYQPGTTGAFSAQFETFPPLSQSGLWCSSGASFFAQQPEFGTPPATPIVEILISLLLPAYLKVYYNIVE